ncbi:MAG: DUF4136 domain-containing protein [Maricaulaceae bacterium]|jgi:hypothetical protein
MSRTTTLSAALAAGAAALAACTTTIDADSLTLNASSAASADSYVFLTDGAFIETDPRYPRFPAAATDALIRSNIEAELSERSLDVAAEDQVADLVIAYSIGAEPGVDTYADIYTGRFGRIREIEVTETEFVEGSLVVDVFDGKTGAPVWRGWAQDEIYRYPNGNLEAAITEAINEIFESFPTAASQP